MSDKDFKAIESQEEFDAAVKDRLRREREKVREDYADYDDIKAKAAKYNDAQKAEMTDLQQAQAKIAEMEAAAVKRDEADKLREARAKVAKATGVPADLIGGADEESMTAFAEKVATYAKQAKPPAPKDPNPGKFAQGGNGNSELRGFTRALLGKESD